MVTFLSWEKEILGSREEAALGFTGLPEWPGTESVSGGVEGWAQRPGHAEAAVTEAGTSMTPCGAPGRRFLRSAEITEHRTGTGHTQVMAADRHRAGVAISSEQAQ